MTRHGTTTARWAGDPMSDHEPGSGVAVWIALRRAHQGGVATLQDHWFDSGRPVPCYVADALDGLTRTGMLMLGEEDPEACGVRRVTVTDAGCAHYEALCQLHNPKATVALRVPDPRFSTKTPAGRRSSSEPLSAPGGQPDPLHPSGLSSSGPIDQQPPLAR